jgi:hypothetical protein
MPCSVCGSAHETAEHPRSIGEFLKLAHKNGGLPMKALDDLAKLEKRQADVERAIVAALADVPIGFAGQIILHVHIAEDGTVTVERPSKPAP